MLAGWNLQRFKSDLPELILVMDTSSSMQTADASNVSQGKSSSRATRWEIAKGILNNAWRTLDSEPLKRYRPKLYELADDARLVTSDSEKLATSLASLSPSGDQSRLGDGLAQIISRQSGRPTAAIVLLSDGIVTSGIPLDEVAIQARKLSVPVYCIATGEQLPQPDLALVDLLADDAVVLGDRVNIQVSIQASDVKAERLTVQLRDMQVGQVVDSTQVEMSRSGTLTTAQLSYVPKAAGTSLIKLEIAPAANEKNLENNVLERAIEVRDQSLRVLMIQKSPSFEYRFLKTLLERTAQLSDKGQSAFELNVVLQDADASHVAQDSNALRLVPGDRETIAAYDVVIIGEIDPSLVASSTQQLIVDQVTTAGCGIIFVCHPGCDPHRLIGWPLAGLLPIDLNRPSQPEWKFETSQRRWHPTMLGQGALPLQLTSGADTEELWKQLPGPSWHYSPGALKPGAQILATAASSDLVSDTEAPLLISQFAGAGRVVLQTTDETYRWISFRGNDLTHERYWNQMLRWLARGKLNRQQQSELTVEPRRARLGEPLQFAARLSPEAAASLGTKTAAIQIERVGGENKTKSFNLQRTQNASAQFKGNDSSLQAGSYRAFISEPADSGASSVTFTVTAPPGEQANLRADWNALQSLAEQTHGKFFTAREANKLIMELPKGNPVRRGALPPLPLWNSHWIALAFVLILSLEWIVRRLANML